MIGLSGVPGTTGVDPPAQAGWREAMLIVGIRVCYRGTGAGTFHCQRCGGDRPYRRRSGRRWFQLLQIPVVPLGTTGEHLRCVVCRTCYRAELLAVPTTAQMQVALLAATTAAALTMLQAGDAASPAARRKAADLIRSAGSRDYSRAGLASDVDRPAPPPGASQPPCASQPPSASQLPGMRQPPGMSQLPDISEGPSVGQGQSASEGQNVAGDLESALRTFALQLEVYAREWFLANVVRIGLADGPLSAAERQVVRTVAGFLGMTQAQAEDVIWLTEEAAQAG